MYWFLLHTLLSRHSLLAVSAAVLCCALNSPISCLFLPSHHNGAGINKGCYRSQLSYLFLSTFLNVIFILKLTFYLLSTISDPNSTALVKAIITESCLIRSQTVWLGRAGLVRSLISKFWGDENHLEVLSHFYFLVFSGHPDSVELTWVWEFTPLENTSSTSELYHWEMLWNPETRSPALLLLPGEDVAKCYVSRE